MVGDGGSYSEPEEDELEEEGLIGRLVSMPEHFGHREGLRRMGFLAEGVIWWMHALDAHSREGRMVSMFLVRRDRERTGRMSMLA